MITERPKIRIYGPVGERMKRVTDHWLLPALDANPFMLEMFYSREKPIQKKLLPWSGEFIGKHLTSLAYFYRLTGDARIAEEIGRILSALKELGGYLGAFPAGERYAGGYVNAEGIRENTWDCWSHYHIMLALFLLDDWRGAEEILLKSAGCMADFFLKEGGIDFSACGSLDINQAVLHIYALLYGKYRDLKYKKMLDYLLAFHRSAAGGDMVGELLRGSEFYQLKYPRWETLHTAQAYVQLYRIYGDERLLRAVERLIDSVLRLDVHNTGGFSSGEQAVGDPFDPRPIETCCTVAFCALCADYLNERADVRVADYLERALFNSVLGSFHASGRWSTYNTPMEGVRRASYDEIGFQCGYASPEINCCSVNAPRGLGLLNDWAATVDGGGVYVHYLGDCAIECGGVTIVQRTNYPAGDQIEFTLKGKGRVLIRIPEYASHAELTVRGKAVAAENGKYFGLCVDGEERLNLNLHFQPYTTGGGGNYQGKASVYCGPLLLAYDTADNDLPFEEAEIALERLKRTAVTGTIAAFTDGNNLLRDFASAGGLGTPYTSWLRLKDKSNEYRGKREEKA